LHSSLDPLLLLLIIRFLIRIALVSSNILKYATKGGLNEGFDSKDNEKTDEKKSGKVTELKTSGKGGDVKNKKADEADESKSKMNGKINEDNVEGMQDKYKELMTLQDTILGQIGVLEESLVSAENVVSNIERTVKGN
jgi:hypothetical protein